MPKIAYIKRRFASKRMVVINQANKIIDEMMADGYSLTLRQLHYQFVARDIPGYANDQEHYKRLGETINDARMAGLVDWDAIVDRTRALRALPAWSSPSNIIDACASQFRTDRWKDQPNRVEVWIEKDALTGVIERICNELHVPFFSCRGYTSQSEMWGAAMRLQSYADLGQRPVILHFGDHDPSGVDMTRDIQDRLITFGVDTLVDRLALNFDQVEQYQPPPNFTKAKDSRTPAYIERFGKDCWELDALDPKTLTGLIRDRIWELIDEEKWEEAETRDKTGRHTLGTIAKRFENVSGYLAFDPTGAWTFGNRSVSIAPPTT